MKKRILVAMLSCLAVATAWAGPVSEIQKLDFLVGEWRGEGWMKRGPGEPAVSLVHETIRTHAGGSVMSIQGRGNLKLEDGSAGPVVHDAFATVSWNSSEGRYRFSAFTAEQGHVDGHFALSGEKGVVWGFKTPQGQIRYTIQINEKGEWTEIGEYSGDGDRWMKFFEMTLAKIGK